MREENKNGEERKLQALAQTRGRPVRPTLHFWASGGCLPLTTSHFLWQPIQSFCIVQKEGKLGQFESLETYGHTVGMVLTEVSETPCNCPAVREGIMVIIPHDYNI